MDSKIPGLKTFTDRERFAFIQKEKERMDKMTLQERLKVLEELSVEMA
jgi:hypothetical protein